MQPKVYALWHSYEKEPGDEDIKLIGVYSSEEQAKEGLEQVRFQPGFRDYPEGFEIDAMLLNRTGWSGGFASPDDEDGETNRE